MASNSLQNNNKIPLHYLDYSVINPLITTPPHSYPSHFLNQNDNNHDLNQINNDAINGDFNDDVTTSAHRTQSEPQQLPKLLPTSALLLLNRPFELDEFESLWESSVIRVIIDGAANRLYQLYYKNQKINKNQFDQILLQIVQKEDQTEGNTPAKLLHSSLSTFQSNPFDEFCNSVKTTVVCTKGEGETTQDLNFFDNFIDLFSQLGFKIEPISPQLGNYLPDILIGDLDSVHPLVVLYMYTIGVNIHRLYSVDDTDLQKALNYINLCSTNCFELLHVKNQQLMIKKYSLDGILTENGKDGEGNIVQSNSQIDHQGLITPVKTCLCYNSIGGRFDQYISIVTSLHHYIQSSFRIILLGEKNIIELIKPGITMIGFDKFGQFKRIKPNEDSEIQTGLKLEASNNNKTQFTPHGLVEQVRLTIHNNKVYCGLVPFLGSTKCSWYGFEWNLGQDDKNIQLLQQLLGSTDENNNQITKLGDIFTRFSAKNDQTVHSVPSSPTLQNVIETSIECGFDGLVSTNNWLKPGIITDNGNQIPQSAPFVFIYTDKSIVFSMSYSNE
jgi:thiamine pyrophosphokinase